MAGLDPREYACALETLPDLFGRRPRLDLVPSHDILGHKRDPELTRDGERRGGVVPSHHLDPNSCPPAAFDRFSRLGSEGIDEPDQAQQPHPIDLRRNVFRLHGRREFLHSDRQDAITIRCHALRDLQCSGIKAVAPWDEHFGGPFYVKFIVLPRFVEGRRKTSFCRKRHFGHARAPCP